MRYINELRDSENVVEFYFCKKRQSLTSKNGKNYLSLTLLDKTGSINGKVWELNNKIQSFEEGDFIKGAGTVITFNGDLQLNIKQIRKAQEGEYDESEYIPSTKKNISELYEKVVKYVNSVENEYIKQLLTNVFIENKKIADKFKKHTAAKSMHHDYLGGLIEHTVSVTEVADFLATHYEGVNRDIVISCALLHDICKIFELSDFPSVDYTDAGELIGHIVMGAEFIAAEADKINGFPRELKLLMQHCILAHHGEYEFGSPKLPRTIESFILHCADDIDAKVKMFTDSLEALPPSVKWTDYNKILQRKIRKTEF